MKTILIALLLSLPTASLATPYFRLIDPKHPQVSAGVFSDPLNNSLPDYGSSLALITHSTKDGSLFKAVQADWVLLGVGGGYGGGQAFMAVGPSANLAPVVKTGTLALLDIVAPGKFANLRELLAPVPDGQPDLNVAFGPQLVVKPIQGGELISPDKWRGLPRVFAGAAWKF